MEATSCCLMTNEEKGIGPILGDFKIILMKDICDVNVENEPTSLPSLGVGKKNSQI